MFHRKLERVNLFEGGSRGGRYADPGSGKEGLESAVQTRPADRDPPEGLRTTGTLDSPVGKCGLESGIPAPAPVHNSSFLVTSSVLEDPAFSVDPSFAALPPLYFRPGTEGASLHRILHQLGLLESPVRHETLEHNGPFGQPPGFNRTG